MTDTHLDHKAFLSALPQHTKTDFVQRANTPTLWRLALFVMMQGVLIWGIILQVPLWPVLMVPLGILHVFLFTLQHECTHFTPFKSKTLNEITGHLIGLLILQPFLWFRYFHLAHHKYTNLPDQDPELAGLPKPDSWSSFLYHLSTVGYWWAKFVTLFGNAFGQAHAGYIPQSAIHAIKREAQMMVLCYLGLGTAVMFGQVWILFIWLIPLVLGFPVLRLYLLAEHGRCAFVANMFLNTRTTYTNRMVRFLAWNMPFHTEHHVFPSVPYHRLGDLNRLCANHLTETSQGYSEFAREYTHAFTDKAASPKQ